MIYLIVIDWRNTVVLTFVCESLERYCDEHEPGLAGCLHIGSEGLGHILACGQGHLGDNCTHLILVETLANAVYEAGDLILVETLANAVYEAGILRFNIGRNVGKCGVWNGNTRT